MRFLPGACQLPQRGAGAAQPAHKRALGNAENGGRLGIGEAFEGNQQQGLLLIEGQSFDGAGDSG